MNESNVLPKLDSKWIEIYIWIKFIMRRSNVFPRNIIPTDTVVYQTFNSEEIFPWKIQCRSINFPPRTSIENSIPRQFDKNIKSFPPWNNNNYHFIDYVVKPYIVIVKFVTMLYLPNAVVLVFPFDHTNSRKSFIRKLFLFVLLSRTLAVNRRNFSHGNRLLIIKINGSH